MSYLVEIRAAEDCRLLGHTSSATPPHELPDYVRFALADTCDDLQFRTVCLRVANFRNGNHEWRAFSVPAAQWDEIKGKVRA